MVNSNNNKNAELKENLGNTNNLKTFQELCPEVNEFPKFEYPSAFRMYSKTKNQVLHEAGYDSLLTGQYFAVMKEKTSPEKLDEFKNKIDFKKNLKISLDDTAESSHLYHFSANFGLNDTRKMIEICQSLKGISHGLFKFDNRLFGCYLDADKESVELVLQNFSQLSKISYTLYAYHYNLYYMESCQKNEHELFDEDLIKSFK